MVALGKTATWRKTPFAHKFYHSKQWQNVRAFVWDRSHGLCERCARNGKMKPADVIHHTIPLTQENMGDPDISLNPDRLMALCHDCHALVHKQIGIGVIGAKSKEKPRVGFDSEGNVVKL